MSSNLRGKEWRLGVIVALGTSLLAFAALAIAGELLLRYREKHRETIPGTIPLVFYEHRRLRHALVRDFQYYDWIHINRSGFRGREVAEQKPPGTVRILAVGSSTTFDSFVTHDTLTWPSQLERKLRAKLGTREIEVINAGVPGYTVLDNLIRLQTELYLFQPDVILLYEGHNDLFSAFRRARVTSEPFVQRPGEIRAVPRWRRWLNSNSMLYTKLAARLQVLQFRAHRQPKTAATTAATAIKSSGGEAKLAPAHYTENYRRDLTSFVLIARSMGIRVIMPEVIHVSDSGQPDEPNQVIKNEWAAAVPFVPTSAVLEGYRQYNQIIREIAQQYDATFLPTSHFGLRGLEFYAPDDPIHFNDRGAERMASKLAESLTASGLLNAPATAVVARGPAQKSAAGPVSANAAEGSKKQVGS